MASNTERTAGIITSGLLLVVAISTAPGIFSPRDGNATPQPAKQLVDFFAHTPTRFSAVDQSRSLQPRDPLFLQLDNSVVQAGYVERIEHTESHRVAFIRWYHRGVSADRCRLVAHRNHGRLEDAIGLMFPPEKRKRMEHLIADALQQHGQRIAQRLSPVLERALRESLPLIEAGLQASMDRHRDELDALAGRWNEKIIEQRLLPLAKQEVVPIVRKHAEPVAQRIGLELWERASIWSFTWRALYDKTPLPRKNLMKQEWERFVEEEAIPVLESHSEQISIAVQKTMTDIGSNQRVRAELAAAADTISRDPQARALLQSLLRESIVENSALRELWSNIWTSDDVQSMLAHESRMLEPTIRRIGDELMGSREHGIDPGFARLLRNQVLQKDQRWVMAIPTRQTIDLQVIEAAAERAVYPMPVFAAQE